MKFSVAFLASSLVAAQQYDGLVPLTARQENDMFANSPDCVGDELCEAIVALGNGTTLARGLSENTIKKLKQLKALVLHLQPAHYFARYCYYGCYCLPDENHKLYTLGYGAPVDSIDSSCKQQGQCYACAQMDHENRNCDSAVVNYNYNLLVDPSDPDNYEKKQIQCLDNADQGEKKSCRRAICECDKKLAEDLRENHAVWKLGHHSEQGDFDAVAECIPQTCENGDCGGSGELQCCGETWRFPYKTVDGTRGCCGSKTYNTGMLSCCDDGSVKATGTC